MSETKTLYLGWYAPETKAWYPVGRIRYDPEHGYSFGYLQGAREARRREGFKGVAQFPDFGRVYRSTEPFAFLANRVMGPKRPNYPEYVQRLGFDVDRQLTPFELLARSNGPRATVLLARLSRSRRRWMQKRRRTPAPQSRTRVQPISVSATADKRCNRRLGVSSIR